MGIDKAGVDKLIQEGKESLRNKFYQHTKSAWEKQGKLPQKKSRWGNICCIIFMVLFFVSMIASKLNEETLSLFGMNSDT